MRAHRGGHQLDELSGRGRKRGVSEGAGGRDAVMPHHSMSNGDGRLGGIVGAKDDLGADAGAVIAANALRERCVEAPSRDLDGDVCDGAREGCRRGLRHRHHARGGGDRTLAPGVGTAGGKGIHRRFIAATRFAHRIFVVDSAVELQRASWLRDREGAYRRALR